MTNSTRSYPRTLNEAFPHGSEYGCAIECPPRTRFSIWLLVLLVSVLGGAITMLLQTMI